MAGLPDRLETYLALPLLEPITDLEPDPPLRRDPPHHQLEKEILP